MAIKPKKNRNEDEDIPTAAEVAASDEDETETPKAGIVGAQPEAPAPKITTTQSFFGGSNASAGEVPTGETVDVSHAEKDDLLLVTMHETIEPAPRVGKYDVRTELNLAALQDKKTYRLPKFVCDVLVDAKKATYVSL